MATGKRAGRKSQQQNDFLEPLAPINVSATDVGTNRPFNNGAAVVSFELPANSPAATSYTVTATANGEPTRTATGASSPITVTNLKQGIDTFITVTATNAVGTSPASAETQLIVTTVPDTPAAPTATSPSGATYDTVTWTAPANGGKAITTYFVESNDGKSGSTASTTININQEAGTSQTYRVRATNANGNSDFSAYSASITTFSFTPFGFTPFGFSPFAFSPFAFSPFGFSPFGFSPFGFTPFGFSPFSFTPFNFTPFGFTPFNFTPR